MCTSLLTHHFNSNESQRDDPKVGSRQTDVLGSTGSNTTYTCGYKDYTLPHKVGIVHGGHLKILLFEDGLRSPSDRINIFMKSFVKTKIESVHLKLSIG